MDVNKLTLIPQPLLEIPQPPKQLFHVGEKLDVLLARPRVTIVGSRKVSPYGRQITYDLASKLAARDVVIVSGLAFGVDTIAHRAALEAGGQAIAVLPCPIDKIAPASNQRLAEDIITQGGALVSEYPSGTAPYKLHFVERNRLMSGLADIVVITEAALKSGSLHTAQFALDQGKDVLAVPGNITSPVSAGTNQLIKNGAGLITDYRDILLALGLEGREDSRPRASQPNEQLVLNLLVSGGKEHQDILLASNLNASELNQTLVNLEIAGKIKPLGPNGWITS